MSHLLVHAFLFVAGYLLGIRLVAALYAPIDLWYTIRTAWPVALRRVVGWSAASAATLLLVPAGGPRRALVVGMLLSVVVHVATWYVASRLYAGKPGPSPVVE